MKISAIYKIQSKIKPEKIYIGSSIDVYSRWGRHSQMLKKGVHDNVKLQCHYNKYGESDLQYSILERCNKDVIIRREQYYIDTIKPWFNICRIAGNTSGVHPSLETRMKISIAGKGLKRSEETKLKMRKPKTKEHNKKVSLAQKGRIFTDEHKRNISKGKTGKISTPAMIEANRKRWLGKTHSPETKIKMSLARKSWHEKHKNKLAS